MKERNSTDSSKVSDKKMSAPTARWVTTMFIAVTIVLLASNFYGFYLLNYMKKQNTQLKGNLANIEASINTLETNVEEQDKRYRSAQNMFLLQLQEIEGNVTEVSTSIYSTQATIDRFETDDKQTKKEIKHLKEVISNQKMEIQKLYAKARYSFDLLINSFLRPALVTDEQPSQPYSYYQTLEWGRQVRSFLTRNPSDAVTITLGHDGIKQYVRISEDGFFAVDGVFYRGISAFNLENNQSNIIDITAPGLATMSGDTLTIRGDVGLDSVILDSCLKWEPTGETNNVTTWEAVDTAGVKKRVEVLSGLAVGTQHACNNRYLERKKLNLIADSWRHIPGEANVPIQYQPRTSRLLSQSVFGGIGIRTSKSDNGLRIEEVLPGSPAEKAGLYAGDTILEINGKPVSHLSRPQAIEAIRGVPGTSITIGYAPSGSVNTIKDISLIRDTINASGNH